MLLPKLTYSSIMSSSLKEVVSNKVPLLQMVTSTQIWFMITVSALRVRFISTEVVAMDVVDMLMGEDCVG